MKQFIKDLLPGAVATLPMTAVMMWLHKKLPLREKYPLPPRTIAMNVAKDIGVKKYMDESDKFAMTMFSHFTFGAVAGSFYPKKKNIKHPVFNGMVYGLNVWAINYLGLLPSVGLFHNAKFTPVRRKSLMIVAHLVWGGTLGFLKSKNF